LRHKVDGRKFGRNTSHRKAMFKNMAASLIKEGRIKTTTAKAKEVRRVVEKLVTLARKETLHARRLAFDKLRDRKAVTVLFNEVAPRFTDRKGGYTRVLKLLKRRLGDAADMSIIEFVDYGKVSTSSDASSSAKKTAPSKKAVKASKTLAKPVVKKAAEKKPEAKEKKEPKKAVKTTKKKVAKKAAAPTTAKKKTAGKKKTAKKKTAKKKTSRKK